MAHLPQNNKNTFKRRVEGILQGKTVKPITVFMRSIGRRRFPGECPNRRFFVS
jgi:hypothetical protein